MEEESGSKKKLYYVENISTDYRELPTNPHIKHFEIPDHELKDECKQINFKSFAPYKNKTKTLSPKYPVNVQQDVYPLSMLKVNPHVLNTMNGKKSVLTDNKINLYLRKFSRQKKPNCRSVKDYFPAASLNLETTDENIIDTYSCALSLRILLQGRIYITKDMIGFISIFNDTTIFGSEPTICFLPFRNIIAIRKKTIALFFRNSIEIETCDHKVHLFASFVTRDKVYNLLLSLWEARGSSKLTSTNLICSAAKLFNDSSKLSQNNNSIQTRATESELSSTEQSSIKEDNLEKLTLFLQEISPYPLPPSSDDIKVVNFKHIFCPLGSPPFPTHSLKNIYNLTIFSVSLCHIIRHLFMEDYFIKQFLMTKSATNITIAPWIHSFSLELYQKFSSDSSKLKFEDLPVGTCQSNTPRPQRHISYTRESKLSSTLTNFLHVPTSIRVEEHWTLFIYSFHCIVLENRITLSGLPFFKCFYILVRYLTFVQMHHPQSPTLLVDIYRFLSNEPQVTKLVTESEIVWKKWSFLRKKIELDVYEEIKEEFNEFVLVSKKYLNSSGFCDRFQHQFPSSSCPVLIKTQAPFTEATAAPPWHVTFHLISTCFPSFVIEKLHVYFVLLILGFFLLTSMFYILRLHSRLIKVERLLSDIFSHYSPKRYHSEKPSISYY